MPETTSFTLAFEGAIADNNQIDFYDAAQALMGFQRSLEPIPEVWIQFEVHGLVRRLSMMRIIARRMNAVTVVA
jgi:hypothetical protein